MVGRPVPWYPGALYSYVGDDVNDGLAACFGASVLFVIVSTAVTYWIDDNEGGLRWGKGLACCGAEPWVDEPKPGANDAGSSQEGAAGGKDDAAAVVSAARAVGSSMV